MAHNRALIVAVLSIAGQALAQEVPGVVKNPYELKPAKPAPAFHVDDALASAMQEKIAACYQKEQRADLTEEDRALLREYGAQLVRDLSAALEDTACQGGKASSSACLTDLGAIDCAKLAQPIIAAGWDRNLPKAAKESVARYAKAIRELGKTCAVNHSEETEIVGDIRMNQLSVLIEAEIVTGRCQMLPDKLDACEQQLQTLSCYAYDAAQAEGSLPRLCEQLFVCRDVKEAMQ